MITVKRVKVISITETEQNKSIKYVSEGISTVEEMNVGWMLSDEMKVGDQLRIIIISEREFKSKEVDQCKPPMIPKDYCS